MSQCGSFVTQRSHFLVSLHHQSVDLLPDFWKFSFNMLVQEILEIRSQGKYFVHLAQAINLRFLYCGPLFFES